jgi:hypothetical protein
MLTESRLDIAPGRAGANRERQVGGGIRQDAVAGAQIEPEIGGRGSASEETAASTEGNDGLTLSRCLGQEFANFIAGREFDDSIYVETIGQFQGGSTRH